MAKFVSSGIAVGKTPRSNREQRHDHLKGNKVTMGKNIPRQLEGAVGDITVRDVSTVGLRCYIKTNSGWYDIHALKSPFVLDWKDIIFTTTALTSWVSNENTTNGERAQYAIDQNGMVQLRGSMTNIRIYPTTVGSLSNPWQTSTTYADLEQTGTTGSGTGMIASVTVTGAGATRFSALKTMGIGTKAGDYVQFTEPVTGETGLATIVAGTTVTSPIATLPPGYRPHGYVGVTSTGLATQGTIKISGSGVMEGSARINADLTFLDGMSFVSKQVINSTAQGGTSGSGSGTGTTT